MTGSVIAVSRRRAPPSAMGFHQTFLAPVALMWKRRACHGTQCLIHQLPPAQSRGSIPAPPQGHSLGGPGWAPPSLDSAHRSSPKMWHFHPPVLEALKGSFRGPLRARQAAPVCSHPPWPPPAPAAPAPSRRPRAGAHTDPSWGLFSGSQCLRIPLMLPEPAAPRWNAQCVPEADSLSRGWACITPISTSQHLFMCLPPPTRCLGDCVLLGTLVHRALLSVVMSPE